MRRQANPTLIGAFLLGSIILAVVGVLIFGSGDFFAEKRNFVLFFDGSVKGLTVGAPVMFRGVKIGSVTDIKVWFNRENLKICIPVYITIEPSRFTFIGTDSALRSRLKESDKTELMNSLVTQGLRAQLQIQSLVTGQLFIQCDFFPEKPVVLRGFDPEHYEVPTIPSQIDELTKTIEKLPLEELVNKLMHAVEGIDKLVHSPELSGSISALQQALNDFGALVKNIDGEVDPVAASFSKTAEAAQAALDQINKTFEAIEGTTGKDSPLYHEINNVIEDLSAAVRSIRVMADYLERHPEALIRGKK